MSHKGEKGEKGEKEKHHPEPLGRDPELPDVSGTTLGFFAAGALVVFTVALFVLFG